MVDAKRGGARPGAGRPKGETTTMVRVPDGCLEQVRQLISVYRNGGKLPSLPAQQSGDAHKQVDLPLLEKVDLKAQLPAADRAWEVFKDALRGRQGIHLIEESYFKLVKTSKVEYSYLFLLQLLERLLTLPNSGFACCPQEWFDMGALRRFANKLYKANPAWH